MAITQERREVAGFDQIRLEGSGIIALSQGEQDSLVIETEASLLPKIKSVVRDGRLELGFQHWYDHLLQAGHPTIHYIITVRQIHGIQISGSGKLEAGHMETDRLGLKVSGAGDLQIKDLQAADVDISFSGTGKAGLSGAVESLEVKVSGSGDLSAEDLPCQDANVSISGSGSIRLNVSQQLEVHISGSGEVRYKGQPNIQHHISGVGTIRPI